MHIENRRYLNFLIFQVNIHLFLCVFLCVFFTCSLAHLLSEIRLTSLNHGIFSCFFDTTEGKKALLLTKHRFPI